MSDGTAAPAHSPAAARRLDGDAALDRRRRRVRRFYLRACDTYFDALWELNQARAVLAAAVGDFSFAKKTADQLPPRVKFVGQSTAGSRNVDWHVQRLALIPTLRV